ncbi:MAG: sensor histidine kinase [Alkalilacustris sp.]
MQRSFAGQWAVGVACLALISVTLAALGIALLHEAERRLDRSRTAGAIHATLVEVAHDKTRLRVWAYRTVAGASADTPPNATPEDRMRLLARMEEGLARIAALDRTARLPGRVPPAPDAGPDAGPAPQPGTDPAADTRTVTLAALHRALDGLAQETAALLRPADPALATAAVFDRLDRSLDAAEGADLAGLMDAALAAEARWLAEERAAADRAVARARGVALGSAAFALPAALGLALWLTAGLRGPLARLEQGVAAFAADTPGHRLGRFRHREFDRLARQLDAMADEIDRHRAREAGARAALEAEVASRTADLSRALDALAASDRARTQLLADVGHGLRTPVTVIRGEAQIALRRPADPTGLADGLTRIVEVTRQMERLIEDVLVLVHGTPAPPVHPRPITLHEALDPALTLARPLAEGRGITLTADAPDIALHADPARLEQVLGCLLDNAVRYSRPGDSVHITARPTPDGALIELTDTGIGIAPEDLPNLATRGWRSATARAHRPDGLGLGLAIATRLAEAHSARLTLTPAAPPTDPDAADSPTTGTTARLHWPATPPAAPSP